MSDPKTTAPAASGTITPSTMVGGEAPSTMVLGDPADAPADDGAAAAWEVLATFDGRLTEAERRIDRVLARLGVD